MTSSVQENRRRLHAEDDIGVKSLNVVVLKYVHEFLETPSFERWNLIPLPFSVGWT